MVVRIRDDAGRIAATASFAKPATGMDTISALFSSADLSHLDRPHVVERPPADGLDPALRARVEAKRAFSRTRSARHRAVVTQRGEVRVAEAFFDELNAMTPDQRAPAFDDGTVHDPANSLRGSETDHGDGSAPQRSLLHERRATGAPHANDFLLHAMPRIIDRRPRGDVGRNWSRRGATRFAGRRWPG